MTTRLSSLPTCPLHRQPSITALPELRPHREPPQQHSQSRGGCSGPGKAGGHLQTRGAGRCEGTVRATRQAPHHLPLGAALSPWGTPSAVLSQATGRGPAPRGGGAPSATPIPSVATSTWGSWVPRSSCCQSQSGHHNHWANWPLREGHQVPPRA